MASSDLAAASIAAGANMNSTLWTNSANEEMQQIDEWIHNNHSVDYFFNTNTI